MKNFLITVLAALVINLLCVSSALANPMADKVPIYRVRCKFSKVG